MREASATDRVLTMTCKHWCEYASDRRGLPGAYWKHRSPRAPKGLPGPLCGIDQFRFRFSSPEDGASADWRFAQRYAIIFA